MYNVTNDSGEESYWSFAHDISERIRYEAQIKRLNQIMETTINNLPAGIVVKEINNDFRYIYRNREAYNRDLYKNDPVGKNDFDFYPPIVAEKKRQEDNSSPSTRIFRLSRIIMFPFLSFPSAVQCRPFPVVATWISSCL